MQRCTFFLLFITGLKISLFAQERITVDAEKRPIIEVLRQIEKQSGYTLSFNPSLLKDFPPVTLQIANEPLEKALRLLFDKTDIQAIIQGKYIILKKKPKEVTISGFI